MQKVDHMNTMLKDGSQKVSNQYKEQVFEIGDIMVIDGHAHIFSNIGWIKYSPMTVELHNATLDQILKEISKRGYKITLENK